MKSHERTGVPGRPERGGAVDGRAEREPGVSRGLPGQGGPADAGRKLGDPAFGRHPSHPVFDHGRDKGGPSGRDGGPGRSSGSGRSR